MSALSSLARFLPEIAPADIPHDPVWRLHETHHRAHPNWYYSRNQLMLDQAALYLDGDPDDLTQLVLSSQLSQAEAKKFFIEQTRLARGRRSGLIWWNLIDPWPQLADAVVDYYGVRKLAFHYIVRAQQQVVMMAREAVGWQREIVLANDSPGPADLAWRIRSATTGEELAHGTTALAAHTDRTVATLPLSPTGDCYLFTWAGHADGTAVDGGNHYTEGAAPLSFVRYRDVYLPSIATLTPTFDADASWR
jgi:beta-mannosidase